MRLCGWRNSQNAVWLIFQFRPFISYLLFLFMKGGLIFKAGGSNMQHVTSLSFLLLAYSNYLSHANKVVPCGSSSATPNLLRQLAKHQVIPHLSKYAVVLRSFDSDQITISLWGPSQFLTSYRLDLCLLFWTIWGWSCLSSLNGLIIKAPHFTHDSRDRKIKKKIGENV